MEFVQFVVEDTENNNTLNKNATPCKSLNIWFGYCYMTTYTNTELEFRILAKSKTLGKEEIREVLKRFSEAMTDIILEGSSIKIDNWGKYIPVTRKSRSMRPRGGESILIPESKTVVFKPTKKVKEILNHYEDPNVKFVAETPRGNEEIKNPSS
jgi:nucleoid DNA-binding protein